MTVCRKIVYFAVLPDFEQSMIYLILLTVLPTVHRKAIGGNDTDFSEQVPAEGFLGTFLAGKRGRRDYFLLDHQWNIGIYNQSEIL